MVLKFEFFILADGGDCEGVTNAHVRAGMLRIKDPLHGPQDDIGEGKHDGALGENECALLIQPSVFGEELRKCGLIISVGFGTAKNEFAADVSASELFIASRCSWRVRL